MCSVLFTTGYGLTKERARALRGAGLTAAFVSLDHDDAAEHNRVRGREDAFETALQAIHTFRKHGLYTAVQAVVSRELLDDAPMTRFLRFCEDLGVHEVMLLEPVPVGGRTETCAALQDEDRLRLISIHRRATRDHTLPKVNTMSFLEGPDLFGCQAGFSFMYVSTSGEVQPCDLVPLSVGNVYQTDLGVILDRLSTCFAKPSCSCLAHEVASLAGYPLGRVVEWERTRTLMTRRRTGELPRLMRSILR